MAARVLPDRAEAERVVLDPDAYSHRVTGDVRLYMSAGYALALQVAHPTVGSGVRDHSTFEQDPWGRLLRTMDYLYLITLSGNEAIDVGRRLRELHKSIKGTNSDGSRYHALEPEAYAWVHATLIEATVRGYRQFVGRLSDADAERFYADWAPMGRLLGIRPGDLPASWPDFLDYFETMVHDRLERTETVDRVLELLSRPAPPPVPWLRPLWPLLGLPPRRIIQVATAGLLPETLRERFELDWSRLVASEYRAMGFISRAMTPILPRKQLEIGHRHLRWRRAEIAAGPLGPGADGEPTAQRSAPTAASRAA